MHCRCSASSARLSIRLRSSLNMWRRARLITGRPGLTSTKYHCQFRFSQRRWSRRNQITAPILSTWFWSLLTGSVGPQTKNTKLSALCTSHWLTSIPRSPSLRHRTNSRKQFLTKVKRPDTRTDAKLYKATCKSWHWSQLSRSQHNSKSSWVSTSGSPNCAVVSQSPIKIKLQ